MRGTQLVFYFLLFLLIKVSSVYFLTSLAHCHDDKGLSTILATKEGDTFSYLGSMENFISEGEYFTFNGSKNVYASRLPHYGLPYYFLRLFFDQETSYDLLALIQVFIECVASFVLLSMVYKWTKRWILVYIAYLLLTLNLSWTFFSGQLLPESVAFSFIVFSVYAFHMYRIEKSTKNLLFLGILLAVVTVLKPYLILLFGIIGISFIITHGIRKISGIRRIVINTVIVSIPLVAMLTPWIIRNYIHFDRFIPFQETITAGYNYSESDFAVRSYMQAWGGNFVTWIPDQAGCFFDYRSNYLSNCSFVLPDYVETEQVKKDAIIKARDYYVEHRMESPVEEKKIIEKFTELTDDFRQEKPLFYYITARLLLLKQYIFNSGAVYVPVFRNDSCNPAWMYNLKYLQAGIYHLCLIIGLVGLLLLALKTGDFFSVSIPILLIILFPFVFRAAEIRMFAPAIPFLIAGFAIFLERIGIGEWLDQVVSKVLSAVTKK